MEIIKTIYSNINNYTEKFIYHNNNACYIYKSFCIINNIKYYLYYYICLDENKKNNTKFSITNELCIERKNNNDIIKYNVEKIIELISKEYNKDDLNKIKTNIINKFNNSDFLLYVICVDTKNNIIDMNNINKDNIINSIYRINNKLFNLKLNIKLYKHNKSSSPNKNLEYITLEENKITEKTISLLISNNDKYKKSITKSLDLEILILTVINKEFIKKLLQEKFSIYYSFLCACKEYNITLKFCSEHEKKIEFVKYIKSIRLLNILLDWY